MSPLFVLLYSYTAVKVTLVILLSVNNTRANSLVVRVLSKLRQINNIKLVFGLVYFVFAAQFLYSAKDVFAKLPEEDHDHHGYVRAFRKQRDFLLSLLNLILSVAICGLYTKINKIIRYKNPEGEAGVKLEKKLE